MKNNLRKLQLCEFEILKKVVDLCNKNNITYYISGGTFLGAVRHKGFIPWDDDIDIAMPRDDYEKFLEIANKNNMKIKNYKTSSDYLFYPTRVIDENIKLVSSSSIKKQVWDAWIDIFPLDGLPNNFILRQFHKLNLLEKCLLLKYSCFSKIVDVKKKRNLVERFFVFIGKHINFEKFLNTKKRLDILDKTLKKYNPSKSKYYMNFMGAYKFKSVMEKDLYYGEGAYYPFEGLQFFGPKNYDKYLTKIYGDYMKIPKKEDQNKHNTEFLEDSKNEKI